MRFDIKTEGFEELDKALGELPEKVAKRTLQRAVLKSMRDVRGEMSAAAPVSETQTNMSLKYGRLRDNIKADKARNKKKSAKSAFISTGDAFWGNFVEYGTKYIPAKPWFVPKFEQLSGRILDILKGILKTEIEKIFKRLKK